jgi:hypothetical protein
VSHHRYPIAALAGDYARAATGLVLAGAPLCFVPLNPYVAGVFALLVALFLLFGWRTLMRQLGSVVITETTIASAGPFPVELRWTALDDVRLAYFATRRDGVGGWMQLALRAGRKRLRLDSRIEDFAGVVERAAHAALAQRLALNRTTIANLASLGIVIAGGER